MSRKNIRFFLSLTVLLLVTGMFCFGTWANGQPAGSSDSSVASNMEAAVGDSAANWTGADEPSDLPAAETEASSEAEAAKDDQDSGTTTVPQEALQKAENLQQDPAPSVQTDPNPDAVNDNSSNGSGGAALALSIVALLISLMSVAVLILLESRWKAIRVKSFRDELNHLDQIDKQLQKIEEQVAQLTKKTDARSSCGMTQRAAYDQMSDLKTDTSFSTERFDSRSPVGMEQTNRKKEKRKPQMPCSPQPNPRPVAEPTEIYIISDRDVMNNNVNALYYKNNPASSQDKKIQVYSDGTVRLNQGWYINCYETLLSLAKSGFMELFDVYVENRQIMAENAGSLPGYFELDKMQAPAQLEPSSIRDGQRIVVLKKGRVSYKKLSNISSL